jgi:hypothetical protein
MGEMLGAGLEPARGDPLGFLRPLRLPFRHPSDGRNMASSARSRLHYLWSMPLRLSPLLILLVAGPLPAASQLPLMTAPRGTLRIELGGAFAPTLDAAIDGSTRPLGSRLAAASFDASRTPLIADLETRLGTILGRPATPGSLGALDAVAEWQRGTGTIGLGWGISSRVTAHAAIPFVSVRTQVAFTPRADGATLGLNPADPFVGDAGGRALTQQFFAEFDGAIAQLEARIGEGAYADDPTLAALAQQTLVEAPTLRASLAALLLDEGASSVLPLATSADGAALLSAIATLRERFGSSLGIAGFGSAPALPTAAVTAQDFDRLLTAPSGFGITRLNEIPVTSLGDIQVGATVALATRAKPGAASWFGAWVTAGATLPTGRLARPDRLMEQPTGDRAPGVLARGTVELGRGRLGLRADAGLQLRLSATEPTRIGARDQLFRPVSRLASLERNPGDIITLGVQPFLRIVDRFAMVGSARYERIGDDAWQAATGTDLPAGLDPSVMNAGTGSSALRVGLGLSYVHDGVHRDGTVKMPVEASLQVERAVWSGAGIVSTTLGSRMMFRVYKRLN